ncbi:hypothetical protein JIG36_47985 [Actinoplanes sp. LDG1-06]|uniref:Uncharacterized protein n=1 Tax=Paractinoplanes ovalisporus TaxID=2810368 RepID=A0ABS2ATR1_9ACTN|nr:hypothetical protein [Actinoplanes ovalisporus]MBM2623264.1 hypothetical protein [Actinoplanes ovalisporus]
MTINLLAGIVALLVLLFVLTEIVSAVLPLIIVLAFVPERERESLARALAALDSSRRLRLWPELRLAVTLRRQQRRVARAARDPRRNPYAHLNRHFADMPGDAPLNPPYDRAEPVSPPAHAGD